MTLQTESGLQIRCFDHFEVLRDGMAVRHWRRDRARLLLKHLVVQARPVTREALLEVLWPGVASTVAAAYLRVVLHALRQAIGTWTGHDYVRLDNDSLTLDMNAPVWIDSHAFVAHVQTAESLVRQADVVAAAKEYAEAEMIYRGDYLAEDALDHWTLLRREELKDRYQVVLTRLADYCLDNGDYVGTIDRCHKLLAQDRCREDAYQRLMYCHAALGQRGRAMRWYEICQLAVRAELGSEPGPLTRRLYEQIAADRQLASNMDWLRGERGLVVEGPQR